MSGLVGRVFLTAIFAGVIAGVCMTALQQLAVFPLILEAESYEAGTSDEGAASGHTHEADGHVHDHEAWAPADGLERTLYSGLANIVTAVGFALLLTAGLALRGAEGWRRGLLWGLGGFLAVNLAPALGLPPELPGAAAADLGARQAWWLMTVGLTACGLALLAFAARLPLKGLGALLIVIPHVVGAPQPEGGHGGLAPAELAQTFIYVSLLTNAAYWLLLGALAGLFFERFGRNGGPEKALAAG